MHHHEAKPRTLLLLWAAVATLLSIASATVSAYLFVQLRSSELKRPAVQASPFMELRDEDVVGHYRWFNGGRDHGTITLRPDHTFDPPTGTQQRFHQWAIGRDALLVFWSSGIDRLTVIEAPGVYSGTKPDGTVLRMERVL